MLKVKGIHHISSIVGHAQRNIDFYTGLLGMRLVKQTLNFDDSSTYHLYYSNHDASAPVFTTFPWNDAKEGENGSGYVGVTSLATNLNTLSEWEKRLDLFNVDHYRYTRFNRERLAFKDMDGLEIEIVEKEAGENTWSKNPVSSSIALKGIDSAILYSRVPHSTLNLLSDILGFTLIDEDEEFYLLKTNAELGDTIELNKKRVEPGSQGVGTVHHIAFAIEDGSEESWRKMLEDKGYRPTEVKDRKYFKSIYFRDKGGILIELASVGPGFMIDEKEEDLGKTLMIPPHFESIKDKVTKNLMPIEVREITKLEGYGYRDKYEYDLLKRKDVIKEEILLLKKLQHEGKLSIDQEKKLEQLKIDLRNVR